MISLESKSPVTVSDRKNRDWVLLHCSSLDEVDAAIKNKPFIHAHIIRGVRRMLAKRVTSDMCLEIWCSSVHSSIWVSIRLEEAEDAVRKILDWRLSEENYEECGECVELIDAVVALRSELMRSGQEPLSGGPSKKPES
jgi:hypothetical protein